MCGVSYKKELQKSSPGKGTQPEVRQSYSRTEIRPAGQNGRNEAVVSDEVRETGRNGETI